MYSHTWLHPNKPQKGGRMQPNKQRGPKGQQAQTHNGKQDM